MRVAKQRKTQNLRKYQEIVETPYHDSPVPSPPTEMKFFPILAKILEKEKLNLPRNPLLHTKTRVSLEYSVNDCM